MTRRREGWAAPDPWQGLRRIQRAQKRLADGSLAGATNLASPVAPVPAGAPLAAVRSGGTTSSIRVSNFALFEALDASVVGQTSYRVEWTDIDEQHGAGLTLATPNITVAAAGVYAITGTAGLGGVGDLELGIELDGSLQSPGLTNRGVNNRATTVIAGVYLDAGATVSLIARNTSGAGLWNVFEPELLVAGPL